MRDYQVERARQMYGETAEDGKRRCTVQRIAGEVGVRRTTLNGYLRAPWSGSAPPGSVLWL
ncbi:hypothetical protein ACFV0L_04015 [Streptosporangium canum]|uniref:hypothetical protein n=1 Tax=Streptosporangium canum TaxID=324952 RepID=UPI00368C23D4